MQARTTRYLVVAMVSLGVAACSDGGPTDAGSAPLRPSSTTTESAGEPAGEQEPTTTQSSPTTTEPQRQRGSGGTTPTTGAGLPFVADTRPDTSPPAQGFSTLVGVDRGEHPGYVRYVFHFEYHDFHVEDHDRQGGPAPPFRPAWDVRYVPRSQVTRHGSGHPVPVEGAAVLEITFEGASLHRRDGSMPLQGPLDLYDLRFGGAFEGYITWFLGREEERPFRAFFTGGDKVVVDVVTR